MKVGILTFHASHNYGSMLQAYALQESLKGIGCDAKIINFRTLSSRQMYACPINPKHSFFWKLLVTNPFLLYRKYKKYCRFNSFMRDRFDLTIECRLLIDVERIIRDERFDAVISGGDQIWNMNNNDFSIAYYLPFDLPGVCKISYSPSFGGGKIFNYRAYGNAIKGLLSGYNSISIRESYAVSFLEGLLGHRVKNICDPVVLFNSDSLLDLAGEIPLVKEPYLFYYQPFSNEAAEEKAVQKGKQMGVTVVCVDKVSSKGLKVIDSAGPIEFLNLIKFASAVNGKSYHLILLSIILGTPFTIPYENDERIESVFGLLGIEWQVTPKGDILYLKDSEKERIKERLTIMRNEGQVFIKESLGYD